ncbi:MAG: calcium/proton exchanger [Acidobacteria bacterium]|nr:calcium/proton exchanger [Acidobacteriota bacterium]
MTRTLRLAASPRVWMLLFLPAVAGLAALAPERRVLLFACACAAMVPLAAWIGRATEQLAERIGEGLGGLVNATLGNAAELILGLAALRHGLIEIVKASLAGSILGNLLLVLGAAVLAGGARRDVQRFNATAARAQSSMLTLAAIGLLAPAAFGAVSGRTAAGASGLSLAVAAVLILTYACGLLFSLRTHRRLFLGSGCRASESTPEPGAFVPWSKAKAAAVLAGAALLAVWVSEVLVSVVEPAARALGMSDLFVGVVVLATVGNAAEHAGAVQVARHDRMDLALGIAVGSSVQVALLVAPLLVLASRFIGPRPMDLVFTIPEVLAMGAAVAIAGQVAADGESNWLEGVQLLAAYAVLAALFFFLPG